MLDLDEGNGFEERSVCIGADPKMKEVMNFVGSHGHEDRLREKADLELREKMPGRMHLAAAAGPPSKALRQTGTEKVDAHLKALLEERDASPPVPRRPAQERMAHRLQLIQETGPGSQRAPRSESSVAKSSQSGTHTDQASTLSSNGNTSGSTFELTDPQIDGSSQSARNRRGALRQRLETYDKEQAMAEFEELMRKEVARKRMDRFQTRLEWRDCMDACLKRLLVDMELNGSPLLSVDFVHRARCEHLDRVYDWYVRHGMKEARKERKAPAFLTFNDEDSVKPGSLRMTSTSRRPAASNTRSMAQSSSSPALLTAGSSTLLQPSSDLRPSSSASMSSLGALGSTAGLPPPSPSAGGTLRPPAAASSDSFSGSRPGSRQRVKRPSGSNPGGAQLGRLP